MNKKQITALALGWVVRCVNEIEAGDFYESLANVLDVPLEDLDPQYEPEEMTAAERKPRAAAWKLSQRVLAESDRLCLGMCARAERLRARR